ncbi:signal peptidase II [Microbacter sp. GSS18]|nr:signal peptidase II [Microbacter sp. GSS18]
MPGRTPLSRAAASIIIAVLAVTVLAADQFTKYLALENLPLEQQVPVLGDFLVFYLVKNPGAAFSLGESVTWLFTLALAAVAVLIVVLAITRVRSRLWSVALGLLLGGVLGNLTDRVFREPGFPVGHVVDFIHTPWMMPAIYNVADIFIVSMMVGVAVLVLVGIGFDGSREQREAADADVVDENADGSAPGDDGESAPADAADGDTPAGRD